MERSTLFMVIGVGILTAMLAAGDDTMSKTKVIEKPEGINVAESARTFTVEGDSFMLDGQPFRYVSGSFHYFRAPRAYWRDRLKMMRAGGLNAVSTYVEWSYHEPEPRQYRWDGDYDLAEFIRIAAEEDLFVLLRPGPYICAERDFGLCIIKSGTESILNELVFQVGSVSDLQGGLPYWLLSKYPNIKLRTNDSSYLYEVDTWFLELFKQMTPLLYGNGGPIIMVQIENEYGSYDACDTAYMSALSNMVQSHVPRTAAVLFTTDGVSARMLQCGAAPGAHSTIDFGPNVDPTLAFNVLRRQTPRGPLVNSEYYPGWLTHWGEPTSHMPKDRVATTLRKILAANASVNFYMYYGGTNFGFTAGANFVAVYQPDITSYDYDAPLTEAGDTTDKYYVIRDVIKEFFPIPPPPALPSAKGSYGTVAVSCVCRLFSKRCRRTLGTRRATADGTRVPTFETLNQTAGLVLYEIQVPVHSEPTMLEVSKPRDRILVYTNEQFKGTLSRMKNLYSLPIVTKANDMLQLLVESQGRINYGSHLKDFKGILSDVKLNGSPLNGQWSVTGFPLAISEIESVDWTSAEVENEEIASNSRLDSGPVLYKASLLLPSDVVKPLDTFVDPTGWGKGIIWVNGHNLGRYWPGEGPQSTLYLPGVYLKPAPAENKIYILELEAAHRNKTLRFIDHHIFTE